MFHGNLFLRRVAGRGGSWDNVDHGLGKRFVIGESMRISGSFGRSDMIHVRSMSGIDDMDKRVTVHAGHEIFDDFFVRFHRTPPLNSIITLYSI